MKTIKNVTIKYAKYVTFRVTYRIGSQWKTMFIIDEPVKIIDEIMW